MYTVAINALLMPAFSTIRMIVTPNRLYAVKTLIRRLCAANAAQALEGVPFPECEANMGQD
jgi:hypothetical protein